MISIDVVAIKMVCGVLFIVLDLSIYFLMVNRNPGPLIFGGKIHVYKEDLQMF